MQIRFLTAIATETGQFMQGRIVRVTALPKAWQRWLEDGVIEILTETPEMAVTPTPSRAAVLPRGRGRGRRSATVA